MGTPMAMGIVVLLAVTNVATGGTFDLDIRPSLHNALLSTAGEATTAGCRRCTSTWEAWRGVCSAIWF